MIPELSREDYWTTSCAGCAHWDLIVIPPSTTPVAQCWSPDDETVGRWYMAQRLGQWTIIGNCTGYKPADLNRPV